MQSYPNLLHIRIDYGIVLEYTLSSINNFCESNRIVVFTRSPWLRGDICACSRFVIFIDLVYLQDI